VSRIAATSDWVEVAKLIPSVLWVGFAILVVLLFRRALVDRLPALTSLELPGGVKAQFDAAIAHAAVSSGTVISADQRSRLERRVARDAELLRGSRVLWIDDEPSSTLTERGALTALGVVIDIAVTDSDAQARLSADHYDVVISDIARGDDGEAGMRFVATIRRYDEGVPILFYIRHLAPKLGTPVGAMGITNRPDEIVDLLLDALARRRL
jgi:CheY-like chemotaxis protein